MRCSVVIPCHGGADLTQRCLESLLEQRGDFDLEILLVDNLGDQATAALAATSGAVRVLRQDRNLGFAGGCNRGLAASTGELVLVLNNDTAAAPHMLQRLHRALERSDRIGLVAPVSNRVKGEAAIGCADLGRTAEGRQQIERDLTDGAAGVVQDTDFLSGLCLLGRRDTWLRLGGFDDRFTPGNFEDDDLCLRARLHGLRLVVARDAFLHHEAHRTFRALGLDLDTELRRQRQVFANKWCHDSAGAAVLAAMAGDHAGAAAAADRARRLHPDWPDADWHLGRHHADAGRHDRAIPHLLALVQQCPHHSHALLRLGSSWLAVGERQLALRLWRWALGTCWFSPDHGAGLLLQLAEDGLQHGDVDAAIADLTTAADLRPGDGALLNRLGAALVEQRRFDEAIPVLERAAAAGLALAHTNLGICHFHRGSPDEALRHFASAAERLPDDPTAQANYRRALAATPPAGAPADTPAGPEPDAGA